MIGKFEIKIAETLAWLALGFSLICHLWAANRGLEMTDEASYLLIALDPWNTWGHGTFHGFFLRPLYLLGGSSVVGMRWIGYAILLIAAGRLASAIRVRLGTANGVVSSLVVPVLMTAAMTVYCGGIRTPCYNWMILVGALVAWSGWMRCGYCRAGPIEFGLGLTMALVGKWGAALILLALFAVLSLMNRKVALGPTKREWGVALGTFALATMGFAFYASWSGIRDTLQSGVLIARTTGSHGWFIVPKYGWEIAYYLYRIGRAFVWLLPAILVFWLMARRDPKKWPPEKIATVLFVAGLSLAAARGWWRGGIEQFGKESVLAGCWLLGVAWTVWAVNWKTEGGRRRTEGGGQWSGVGSARAEDGGRSTEDGRRWLVGSGRNSVLWALVLTPFLCGIGTNTSIADYAGQGTVFFAAAGILLFGRLHPSAGFSVATCAMVGLCLIQASRVSSALLGMYRLGSVFNQTEIVSFGPERQRLMVTPEIKNAIEPLEKSLTREGFHAGDPLIGVDSLCGVVYLAGGQSPGMPWFFRDQTAFLKKTLAILPKETLQRSWLLIRSSSASARPSVWWPSSLVLEPTAMAVWSAQWDGQTETFRVYHPTQR